MLKSHLETLTATSIMKINGWLKKQNKTKHPLDHQEIKTEAVKRPVIQSYEQSQNPEP